MAVSANASDPNMRLPGSVIGLGHGLAFCLHLARVAVSRWHFFAEAAHVVRLHCGHDPAAA